MNRKHLVLALTSVVALAIQGCAAEESDSFSDERSDVLDSLWDCQVTCEGPDGNYESAYQACALSDRDAVYEDGLVACGDDIEVLDGTCTRAEDTNNACTGASPTPAEKPYDSVIEEGRAKVASESGSSSDDLRLVAMDFYPSLGLSDPAALVFYDSSEGANSCLWVYDAREGFQFANNSPSYELFSIGRVTCDGASGPQEDEPRCEAPAMMDRLEALGANPQHVISFEDGYWWSVSEDASGNNYRVSDDC